MRPIVLDPGHGGFEPAGRSTPYGARGPTGTYEKDLTLRVAQQIAARLGGQAILTRTDDRNLSLRERIGVAVQRDARAFVSLHAGAAGPSLWVHPRADAASRRLAADLAARLGAPRVEEGELGVLAPGTFNGRTAACMIELGELSEPRTEQWLRYGGGDSIAARIAEGLDDGVRWDVLEGRLRYGCVVDLEIRMNNERTEASHAFPIDVNGRIRMPMLGLVDALDLSLQQLAQNVQRRLTPDYFRAPTVNATLKHRIVAYGANITQDRLHLRILDRAGRIEGDSGWYPVRNDGTLNLPYVGVVRARDRRLDEVEAEVERGYQRDYVNDAVVHLTPMELDGA